MAKAGKIFQCDQCETSFKYKHHLKNHVNICKGKKLYEVKSYNCELCSKAFTLKHHLKRHILICKIGKDTLFKCKECDIKLTIESEIQNHKEQCSNKFDCDFCEHRGYTKNMKRHYKTNHKGLTPSLTARPKPKKVNKCNKCLKLFFDKATLNRHTKNVHKSKKQLQFSDDVHIKEIQNENVKTPKKHVKFSDDVIIKEIPYTKASINSKLHDKILNMFENCEQFMLIFTNRHQAITLKELTIYIESKTKETFDIFAFRTLNSVFPESYSLYIHNNTVAIKVQKLRMTPSLINQRKKVLSENLKESQKYFYIDLIEFPQIKVGKNSKAKDIIKKNIIDIEHIEKELHNNVEVMDVKIKKVSSSLPKHLVDKIQEKQRIRNIRNLFFETNDWQIKKMPALARKINAIFISEQKSVLKKNILIEKSMFSETQSFASVEKDIDRLISESNGWLKIVATSYIKRIDSYNINDVCDSF